MYAGRLTFLLASILAALLHTGDAACLKNWYSYEDNCYIFIREKVSWFNAESFCRASGGNLLEIRSRPENQWIVKQIKKWKMDGVWLGSSDILREGDWKWLTDGEDVETVADWTTGNPDNNNGEENCLEISEPFGYKWNDWKCQERKPFACKASAILPD